MFTAISSCYSSDDFDLICIDLPYANAISLFEIMYDINPSENFDYYPAWENEDLEQLTGEQRKCLFVRKGIKPVEEFMKLGCPGKYIDGNIVPDGYFADGWHTGDDYIPLEVYLKNPRIKLIKSADVTNVK